jgi:hypothetical protein
VQVLSAECTTTAFGQGEWEVDDGSGALRVGALGFAFVPTLGTQYDVTGCIDYESNLFKIEPRSAGDIVWAADAFAPVIETVSVTSDTTLLVIFSEDVEQTTADTPANYTIAGLTVSGAARDAAIHSQVALTVSTMTPGTYTLSVVAVSLKNGNATAGAMQTFDFVSHSPPAGYYDTAEGLTGDALRARYGTSTPTFPAARRRTNTRSASTRAGSAAWRAPATTASIPGRRAGSAGAFRRWSPTSSSSIPRTTSSTGSGATIPTASSARRPGRR